MPSEDPRMSRGAPSGSRSWPQAANGPEAQPIGAISDYNIPSGFLWISEGEKPPLVWCGFPFQTTPVSLGGDSVGQRQPHPLEKASPVNETNFSVEMNWTKSSESQDQKWVHSNIFLHYFPQILLTPLHFVHACDLVSAVFRY